MKIKEQVTNLELSKKLKQLGVKQESYFMWVGDDIWNPTDQSDYETSLTPDRKKWISAFTVAELGEMLPARITNPITRNMDFGRFHKGDDSKQDNRNGYTVEYHTSFSPPLCRVTADTEVNARAKMLIYLIENNLIDK